MKNTAERNALKRLFLFSRWPIVIGALMAMATLLLSQNMLPLKKQARAPDAAVSSYAKAVSRAAPAVVNIYTRKKIERRRHPLFDDPLFRHFFNNSDTPRQQRMESSMGSGVVVTEDGYLLTNNHVISGVDEIVVSLNDGREAQAELVGVDKESDLAVLKINLDKLTPIPIGKPESGRVGDVVLAIGNPFGIGQTVTQGIISATRRRGFNISLFENFIQTDAAINPGNSGGALIDVDGQLLGINTANLAQSGYTGGIGFAIPADTAIQTLNDIVEFGRVVRGWLGVEAQALSQQLANSFRLNSTNGVIITAIYNNGPADKAGLLPGDVITRINQQWVGNGRWGIQEIGQSRPGDKVEIEVIRAGEVKVLQAILGSRPVTS